MTKYQMPARRLMKQLGDMGLSKRMLPVVIHSSEQANGVASFIPAILQLQVNTNTPQKGAGGDSLGMVGWIQEHLSTVSKQRPYCEIQVRSISGPPSLRAEYNNGSIIEIKTARWTSADIHRMVNRLCDAKGKEAFAVKQKVRYYAGPQPVKHWDPFHAETIFRP